MFTGLHAIIYVQDAERARAFFRDVLGFRHVDAGDGWLIFAMPPAELAFHPTEEEEDGAVRESGSAGETGSAPDQSPALHQVYLMCNDVRAAVEALQRKGVVFTRPITDHRWGLLTTLRIPGGGELGIYQPRHPTALGLGR